MNSKTLRSKSFHAAKWSYFGVAAKVAVQFAVQIALARVLGPDQLGLFALALLVINISLAIVDLGLGSALVQKPVITDADSDFVFTRSVVAGIVLSLIVYIGAPGVSLIFADERLAEVLRGVAAVPLLQALAVTPLALMKRDLLFKQIQIFQLSSYLVGFLGVGLGLAALGAGVVSLVAAWLTQSALLAALVHWYRPQTHRLVLKDGGSGLSRFGSRALMTNCTNWVMENIDNALVGRYFGAASLGLYSISYNIVRAPANHMTTTMQTVLFSASARVQGDSSALSRGYLAVTSAIALIAFPVFASVSAISDTVVAGLLGQEWSDAAEILRPLALSMIAYASMTGSVVLWGDGKVEKELRVQVGSLGVLMIAVLAACQHSMAAVAWAVLAAYCVRAIWLVSVVLSQLRIKPREYARGQYGGYALAALVATTVSICDLLLTANGMEPSLRLLADIGVAGLCFASALILYWRPLVSDPLKSALRGHFPDLERLLVK